MELNGQQERVIGIYRYGLGVAGAFRHIGREFSLQHILEDLFHQVCILGKQSHLCSNGQKKCFSCDLLMAYTVAECLPDWIFVRLLVNHIGIHDHDLQTFQDVIQVQVFPSS